MRVKAKMIDAAEDTKTKFYQEFEDCNYDLPQHDLLLVAGNVNTRIVIDSQHTSLRVVGKHIYHDATSNN